MTIKPKTIKPTHLKFRKFRNSITKKQKETTSKRHRRQKHILKSKFLGAGSYFFQWRLPSSILHIVIEHHIVFTHQILRIHGPSKGKWFCAHCCEWH